MQLDHIGIATDDAAGFVSLLGDLLDLTVVHEETFDEMELVFLDVGGAELELIEPAESEGPVARFLDQHGSGLHHLAFETQDIRAALERAGDLGLDRIDEAPRPGARGHTVAFLHPRSTGGVLLEFVEP